MDTLLIVALIAFVAGVVLSGRGLTQEPQRIYIVAEPEQRSQAGCLLPLILVAALLIIVLLAQ